MGYIVEWRVINAAEYAMPQKRRRTYIVGYKKDGIMGKTFTDPEDWVFNSGVFAKAFPVLIEEKLPALRTLKLSEKKKDCFLDITDKFNKNNKMHPFEESGVMLDGIAYTVATIPSCNEKQMTIRDVMVMPEEIPEEQISRWKYLKGAKRVPRTKKNGIQYVFAEDGMEFPDSIDKPSKTISTSEGGKNPDRCRHIIIDETGRYRRLVPAELEGLNMFPKDHIILSWKASITGKEPS